MQHRHLALHVVMLPCVDLGILPIPVTQLVLPVEPVAHATIIHPSSSLRCAMRPFPHVLIVDDDDAVRALLARIVARTYPAVHLSLAADGLDALSAFDHDPANLVLTNYDMPRMNGPALVQALRVRTTTVPIVMISADPGIATTNGITAFIAKPFRARDMQQLLARLLPP